MLQLKAEYNNVQQLYRNYMPFINNGGLFFPTSDKAVLGEEVKVSLLLPDDLEPTDFQAKVVWLNPRGAQGGRPVGIGISLDSSLIKLRSEIEKLLNRKLNSHDTTSTI